MLTLTLKMEACKLISFTNKICRIQGVYNNGEQRNNISSTISLQSINCQVNGKDLKGSLTYSNFNNPYIQTQFNTELNLEDIQKWVTNTVTEIIWKSQNYRQL